MSISIAVTENARQHIDSMLRERGKGIGLRLGLRQYGCSGYGYDVDYADQITDDDMVFEDHGVKVVINQQHVSVLNGLTIDFVKTNAINSGFEFINPNAEDSCGCGESFNLKEG